MIFVEFPAIFDYFHVYFATWSKYFATWDLFRGSGALPPPLDISLKCSASHPANQQRNEGMDRDYDCS